MNRLGFIGSVAMALISAWELALKLIRLDQPPGTVYPARPPAKMAIEGHVDFSDARTISNWVDESGRAPRFDFENRTPPPGRILYLPSQNSADLWLQFETFTISWGTATVILRSSLDLSRSYELRITKVGGAQDEYISRAYLLGGDAERLLAFNSFRAGNGFDLTVELISDRFSVLVNGQPVLSWQDKSLSKGAFGLACGREDHYRLHGLRFWGNNA